LTYTETEEFESTPTSNIPSHREGVALAKQRKKDKRYVNADTFSAPARAIIPFVLI
jgi:hypothetical protein